MKLIPGYLKSGSTGSEGRLFQRLGACKELGDWVCLHSYNLSRHLFKREGEIDFLLLGPKGIFVLEVKGGRVERHDGRWVVTDANGRRYQKKESPFDQAKSALYSLVADLEKNQRQQIKNHVIGYGVVFVDVEFKHSSAEWDSAIICDKADINRPISEYLTRLAGYWRSRRPQARGLNKVEVADLTKYLRGDFETVATLRDSTEESEREIARLTVEQTRFLDATADNPRILLSGAAGTGKTVLAAEMFKRNRDAGLRTLLLCYNNLLVAQLKALLKCRPGDECSIETLHHFMRTHIGMTAEQIEGSPDKARLFSEEFPDKFLATIRSKPLKQFDYLIVDEAQDITSVKYLYVLDATVKGGMESGRWLICLDEKNQNIYSGADRSSLEHIKNIATCVKLTTNCRNTVNIAEQTELVTGITMDETDSTAGLPVEYIWYKNSADQIKKVADRIKQLVQQGFLKEDIVILSPRKETASLVGNGLESHFKLHKLAPDNIAAAHGDSIGYTTVHAFKGLESKIVILTDVESIDENKKLLNYVGFTRARSLLIVAVRRDQRKSYYARLKSFLSRKGLSLKSKLAPGLSRR